MAKCLDVCFHNAEPKWQQSRARGLGANVNIIPITLQPRTSWVLCLKQYGGTLHIVTAMRSYQNCGKNSINIFGRGTSADQKLNNLWRKHQQAPGSCLIVNWCAYKEIYRKFTRAWIYARIAVSGPGTWALHYCCLRDFPRWQHLHVRSGGAASRRKEILVVTHQPGPAPSHADNIQINFLFLMEFFTTCKCLWDCLGQTADRNRNVQWLTIE